MRQIILRLINLIEKVTGKSIAIIPKNRTNSLSTAVKSDAGFWYAGDIFSRHDIAYGLLSKGIVEPEGTLLVEEVLNFLVQKKDTICFYDIGANTGYFGILAAFLGKGKITTYAFEPIREFNEIEQQTVYLNRMESLCRIFSVALGNENRDIEIYLSGSGTSIIPNFIGEKRNIKRTIQEVRIDDFTNSHSLHLPDFMKIDVEGFEYQALQGGSNVISTSFPVIWYECAGKILNKGYANSNYVPLVNFLKEKGYIVYKCEDDFLKEVVNPEDVPTGMAMYLALHTVYHSDLKEKILYRIK